jgi:hypothetical protein
MNTLRRRRVLTVTMKPTIRVSRFVKTTTFAACAAILGFGFTPQQAVAGVDVSFNFFYDSLQPYGQWVDLDEYGSCWVPSIDDPDWRPYNDGSWEYTEVGWTWVSNEPWGWATYHYGRWVYFDDQGWAWVPGYEWGPAWVSWRTSDDYIGWAPLPPEPYYARRGGFSISFSFGPSWYNFCETRYFGHRRLRDRICRSDRNVTIINKTVNKTKIVYNNSTIINEGPDLEAVNRRSERRIERTRLQRRDLESSATLARNTERRRSRVESSPDQIVAPTADPSPERVRKQRRTDRPVLETRQEPAQDVQSPPRERKTRVEKAERSAVKAEKPAARFENAPRVEKTPRVEKASRQVREQSEPRAQRSVRGSAVRSEKPEKRAMGRGDAESKPGKKNRQARDEG